MTMETFEGIIRNVSHPDFTKDNQLHIFRVGENGDCFLNKNVFDMLRLIRRTFPGAAIELYNHFKMLTPQCADVILGESLVDSVFTNIDGLGQNYERAKRADFDNAIRNVSYFVEQRSKLGRKMPLAIRVLTINQYVETLKAYFDAEPAYVGKDLLGVLDDFDDTNEFLSRIIDGRQDRVTRSGMIFWAERETLKDVEIIESYFRCPQLSKNVSEVFVSPEGKAYLCCLDSKQELVYGDLMTTSICDILAGERRTELIDLLSAQQFSKVGGPCKTVHCCQVYHKKRLASRLVAKGLKLLGLADWSRRRGHFMR